MYDTGLHLRVTKAIRRVVVPALLLLFVLPSHAQPLSEYRNGRVFTFSKDNKFWLEFQDKQGFIWGTDQNYQLIRYDGHEVEYLPTTSENAAGVEDCGGDIKNIFEDAAQNLWIATTWCGLDRFNFQDEQFEHFSDEIFAVRNESPRTYLAIFQDSQENIWIGTQVGLYKYSVEDKSFSFASTLPQAAFILEDREGNIWAGNPLQRIFRKISPSDPEEGEDIHFPFVGDLGKYELLFANEVKTSPPATDRPNVFFFNFCGHWYRFDISARKITHQTAGLLSGELIYSAFHDGITLVGTNKGRVLEYDYGQERFLPFFSFKELPGPPGTVKHIFRTREGLLWIVCQEYTFQVMPGISPFRMIPFPENARQTVSFGSDESLVSFNGTVFFHTTEGLQPVIEGETGPIRLEFSEQDFEVPPVERQKFSNQDPPKAMSGFNFEEDAVRQKLWLLLYQYPYGMKLFSYDKAGRKTFEYYCSGQDTCFNDRFLDMDIDNRGRLWMAGWRGVSCFDPESQQFTNYTLDNGLIDQSSRSIECGQNGYVWICTNSRGLTQYDMRADSFTYFLHDPSRFNSLSTNYFINDIIESQDGRAWVITLNGLNRYDAEANSFERVYEKLKLSNKLVYALIEDKNHCLWMVSGNHLIKYDPEQQEFYLFGLKDGVPKTPLLDNMPFSLSDDKGRLFFKSIEDVVYFHPDSVPLDDRMPDLLFTGFQLANQPVKVGDSTGILSKSIAFTDAITLKYSQNVFSIRYSALEYLHPEEVTYAFQLEGFDDDFREVGSTREATYTNLSPRDYLFKVKCRNHHGFWSEPIKLNITVLPPWYRSWWAYGLWLALLLGALYAFYRFQLNRQLARAETHRLRELDEVKTRLYANITHEFRTPLTIILGMVDKLVADPAEWLSKGAEMIRRNGQNLLRLVNQMLDLSKLESGKLKLNMAQGDIVPYLQYVVESFHSYAELKDIRLHFYSEVEEMVMDYDPDNLLNIISNLLSNAVKFTDKGGDVYFSASRVRTARSSSEEELLIKVRDTGIGIPPDKLPHIFSRFYQVDDSNTRRGEGTGIGLALIKELVKLMEGRIEAKSTVGKGTEFSVYLPIRREAPLVSGLERREVKEEVTAFTHPRETDKVDIQVTVTSTGENPTALIIEDNADVVRYLMACLEESYQLEVAYDGQQGIEKALETVPDIIVSDVMMPEKDGFEVCDTLKNDERTSHIPIVLLTAKADIQSKITGLKRGADAYLPKPFDKAELLAQMENLVEQRKKLQKRYQGELPEPAPEYPEMELEDAFLQKVKALVEENLDQADFDITRLARKSGMSRVQLFRKVKALTGKSPSIFVRSVRLHKARALLLTTELNVSEVAYDAGFSDPAFFSRAFREEFGQSPTEVREGYQG